MLITAVIPTYNESENIKNLIDEILALPLDIHVLVADDDSPDGTSKIVEEMSKNDNRVHLLLRKERRGRGWAGIDGFKKALEMGAEFVVEMDGDGSHSPRFIPVLHAQTEGNDIVVGSRYVAGGKDEHRSFARQAVSMFARRYLSAILGIKVSDPTSGFRVFTREALGKIVPRLNARDPFIVTEVLFYAKQYGLKIKEVPIEFLPRARGESKLKSSTLVKYLFRVLKLKFSGNDPL
ncbi:MAG: polyprenol monophosphomannose synthase [Endomicrobiales bacterium]|nr:polyprenol monophosphomannose synthase [Endomicrobiales bacterium]